MDSFLVLLLVIAGIGVAAVTKVLLWLMKKDFEKMRKKRHIKMEKEVGTDDE